MAASGTPFRRRSLALALALSAAVGARTARAQVAADDVYPDLPPTPAPEPPPAAPPEPAPEVSPVAPLRDLPGSSGQPTRVRYALEGIEVRGNRRTAERVVLRWVKYRPGDVLDVDDPDLPLVRYRLLGTGFFSSVQLSLRKGSRRGSAVLVIEVVERNTLIVRNLWLGVAADEDDEGNSHPISPFVGFDLAETNLAGAGITLGAGVGLATDQLALRLSFAHPAVGGGPYSLRAGLLYSDARDFFGDHDVRFESPRLAQREVTDYAVVAYKRSGAQLGVGRDLGVSTQLELGYRIEQVDATVPIAASHLRGRTLEPIDFDVAPGKTALSVLSARLAYDTRDSPTLPTRGALLSTAVTAGLTALGSDYPYGRLELSLYRWWRLPWKHVVRVDGYAGAILGDAPFFEKFYVGDFTDLLPDRLLDLAPDRRKPPNFFGTSIAEVRYGDVAARLGGEYRVPLYTGRESVYGIDLFASAGLYAVATQRDFRDPASGYRGLARVPIDLTFNTGVRVDTSFGLATFAFSNFLGFLPSRGTGQ